MKDENNQIIARACVSKDSEASLDCQFGAASFGAASCVGAASRYLATRIKPKGQLLEPASYRLAEAFSLKIHCPHPSKSTPSDADFTHLKKSVNPSNLASFLPRRSAPFTVSFTVVFGLLLTVLVLLSGRS
jgi:hypothetical protein